MKFADLAVSAFLILFPLAWLASSAYGTWKEYHRHIEQIKTIDNMRRNNAATESILEKCLNAETACLTATHSVPGVFKLKITFELLDSESTDRG